MCRVRQLLILQLQVWFLSYLPPSCVKVRNCSRTPSFIFRLEGSHAHSVCSACHREMRTATMLKHHFRNRYCLHPLHITRVHACGCTMEQHTLVHEEGKANSPSTSLILTKPSEETFYITTRVDARFCHDWEKRRRVERHQVCNWTGFADERNK